MNSVLSLRIKSFFIDVFIVISTTMMIYFILKAFVSEPNDKTMNTIRNWISQIYLLGCLVLIPAKTFGMKINKVSFKSINGNSDIGLWAIVKFYFFQIFFLVIGFISVFFILNGQINGISIGIIGLLISVSDLAPYFMKQDYIFFHDKFSGVKIAKD